MKKYQLTITFPNYLGEDFLTKIPTHRAYINSLILNEIVEYYSISAQRSQGWIVMNARSEEHIHELLAKSPLYKFFHIEIDQLMVYDTRMYRLPKLVLN